MLCHTAAAPRSATHYVSRRAVRLRTITFKLPRGTQPSQTITVAWDKETVVFIAADGTVLAEWAWPPAGVTNVGGGDPRGRIPCDGPGKCERKGRPKE